MATVGTGDLGFWSNDIPPGVSVQTTHAWLASLEAVRSCVFLSLTLEKNACPLIR